MLLRFPGEQTIEKENWKTFSTIDYMVYLEALSKVMSSTWRSFPSSETALPGD